MSTPKGYVFSDKHRENLSKAIKGRKFSEQTKIKIGLSTKGKTYEEMYGVEKAKLLRERMSKAMKGKKISEEHKKILSKVHKGRKQTKEHIEKRVKKNTGKKRTEETRELMRKSNKHNKACLGKTWKWSTEAKKRYSDKVKKDFLTGKRYTNKKHKNYLNLKYKNITFKSEYELKVAKWLDEENIKWEYESKNCRKKLLNQKTYIIDFYLPEFNKYIEVKGWWDNYSRFKFYETAKDLDICIIDKRNIDNLNLKETKMPYYIDDESLDEIFLVQIQFQELLKNDIKSQQYINQMVLGLIEETVELLKTTPHKAHKKHQEFNEDDFKKELVDVFIYIVNLALSVGITSNEFLEMVRKKQQINFERQKNNY